jgi:hypothetical protein
MKKNSETFRQTTAHKFDPDLLVRELANLQVELTRPITAKRLELWIAEDKVRKFIMLNSVWGTIRWPKTFGKPITPIMASAFDIEHSIFQIVGGEAPGAPKWDALVPSPAPSKWDGPDDKDYYRVNFSSNFSLGHKSEIRVRFAMHVRWVGMSQFAKLGSLEIYPSLTKFEHKGKEIVVVSFKVINMPFFG